MDTATMVSGVLRDSEGNTISVGGKAADVLLSGGRNAEDAMIEIESASAALSERVAQLTSAVEAVVSKVSE